MTALEVRFTGSRWAVYVAGGGAYRMLRNLRDGRPPEFDRRRRRYVVTERVARDLLAAAEADGRRVVVTGQSETDAASQGVLW
ncbi:hypothetical protein D0Z08_19680 [Nocardioides immobilis]|uniref:Uncharacterized protein n=1 Tax=Nocardioides immobilis TaxID=2049295 RepID=A0A417XYL0_9ACTN|nr:hypothetical protein [Nocardioides immobilis]RHW25449.1 hypothetical protein D0Z08_19680 [Nocardioides immobilis]